MKQFKLLTMLALFVSVNLVSAQKKTAAGWPQMQTVQEVAARIQKNVEQNNKDAFYHAETLSQHVNKLASTNIPREYVTDNVKQNIQNLQTKAAKLAADSKGKVAFDTLKTQFAEIQTLIEGLANPNKK